MGKRCLSGATGKVFSYVVFCFGWILLNVLIPKSELHERDTTEATLEFRVDSAENLSINLCFAFVEDEN